MAVQERIEYPPETEECFGATVQERRPNETEFVSAFTSQTDSLRRGMDKCLGAASRVKLEDSMQLEAAETNLWRDKCKQ